MDSIAEATVDATGSTVESNAVPQYQCEEQVRSNLFGSAWSTYSSITAPLLGDSIPLNVSVGVSFYHATEVSTVSGTAEVFFGFYMSWVDERLQWDPSTFGGCRRLTARASLDAEKTDIWVPDFDLLNKVTGVQSLPDTAAIVHNNGTVTWGRLGGVKAICFFDGLERFPYDQLACNFTFGSDLPLPVNYILDEDLLFQEFGEMRVVAKYQEYTILPNRTTIDYSDLIRIGFVFERASRYYTTVTLVPTIVFTVLSFGVFLLDVRVGERLAFGVSLLLVIVANSIVTAGLLPICSERLWINVFVRSSYYWVLAALVESVAVAYLFFLESEERKAERREREEKKENNCIEQRSTGSREGEYEEGHLQDDERDTEEPGNNSHEVDRTRPELMRQIPFRMTLRHMLILGHTVPSHSWRMKAIRNVDRACLILFPTTYVVFISTMFARNKYW